MGFNTVVLILNDIMSDLKDSPKTVAHLLSTSYIHGKGDEHRFREVAREFAKEFGEPVPHSQALMPMPTYHADDTHYLRAGGNCLVRCATLERKKVLRRFYDHDLQKMVKREVWIEEVVLPDFEQKRLNDFYERLNKEQAAKKAARDAKKAAAAEQKALRAAKKAAKDSK
jgi:hypothetical protein